ncbi:SDR family oxidoreductase [Actinomyces howellii]|uniref:Glucose 1-dehydrogenase n=1 Tax=Actinomyces howellii TaxID=52771 RepID=A0A448HJX2_9ACTO|nr:SDR family oxidoreductase [Actinomyces howellii]VEG30034.1 Glucose 1-dehydrogenase [Actinomyces howellii]
MTPSQDTGRRPAAGDDTLRHASPGAGPRAGTAREALPLAGRVVVVTGVSRRAGIGHAVACLAADWGASLLCHHYRPHDEAQPWGADCVEATMDSVRSHLVGEAALSHVHADLREAGEPERVIEAAVERLGGVDALVCNQASSGRDGRLEELSAADLDHHWAVSARASLLLTQAYAARTRRRRGPLAPEPDMPGSVVLMTSGQDLGPMPEEIAYCTAKAALAGMTPSLAAGLAERGIRLNTVNPGPVDTGYMGLMDPGARAALAARFPGGRLAGPRDPAGLICWLLTDEAAWVTGQVVNAEGGFRR